MLYFVPAWYKQNTWCENEQEWYTRRMKSEFDETIKQITLFHRNVGDIYRILVLGYSPNFRHFLHRQGMFRLDYWSCFDAMAQIRRKKAAVLSYHDIKWPDGIEFVYSPFSIVAMQNGQKYAQVEFGEDGNPISIAMYSQGMVCRRNYYDDRGFVSSTVILENGKEQYQDYLSEKGIWKIRHDKKSGLVYINPAQACYDLVTYGENGQELYEEIPFSKSVYSSMAEVIQEVFASYISQTQPKDKFFVAAHPLHVDVVNKVLKNHLVVATFFENRYDLSRVEEIADFLENAAVIITDSDYSSQIIYSKLRDVDSYIADIPPYDTRMDFGISPQLKVQNILVPIDGMEKSDNTQLTKALAEYLSTNDLARVHFFTRDASWKLEERVRNILIEQLEALGYDKGWAMPDGRWIPDEENPDEGRKIEQRFFINVCVDERDISKCINEQRVILDLRRTMDVYLYVTAISKGVPRISMSQDQFLRPGGNGMIIEDYSQISDSLAYYLDSFENWNNALVACYELGQKYTTSLLLKKWRKVLKIIE